MNRYVLAVCAFLAITVLCALSKSEANQFETSGCSGLATHTAFMGCSGIPTVAACAAPAVACSAPAYAAGCSAPGAYSGPEYSVVHRRGVFGGHRDRKAARGGSLLRPRTWFGRDRFYPGPSSHGFHSSGGVCRDCL